MDALSPLILALETAKDRPATVAAYCELYSAVGKIGTDLHITPAEICAHYGIPYVGETNVDLAS